MRFPFIVLTIVALSLAIAAPVVAHEGDTCAHDVATVAALRECVEHAAHHGHIDNAGVARSLLATLDAAQSAVDQGRNATAIRHLEAFIHEVEAQAGKHIVAEHADHLIEHTEAVIQTLGR